MKLLIDFDRVIFNHDAYMAAVKEHSLEAMYADPSIWQTLKVTDYLYEDVIPFISRFPAEDVVIISAVTPSLGAAAEAYQKAKLDQSGLDQYVSKIILMEGVKAPYVAKEADTKVTLFIDDKLEHHRSVRQACPQVTCLQMVRPSIVASTLETDPAIAAVVSNFAEVSAFVETLH